MTFNVSRELKNKFVNIDEKDEESIRTTLYKRQLSGTAQVVQEYEDLLKDLFNTNYSVTCCNGTAAIHMALLALGVKKEDEVMLPPTAPIMTVLPILLLGAKPVFVDTKTPTSFSFNLKDMKKKLSSKTKTLITVPMWGYPIEMEEVIDFAKHHNVSVIEDCSQAHGTKLKHKYLGTYGDIGVFSTHDRKLICTGEGAFTLTNNKELFEKMSEIRAFGIVVRDNPELSLFKGKFGLLFGFNYKINALGAALGISQSKKLAKKINTRTNNANYLKEKLKYFSWIKEIFVSNLNTPNYYALVLEIAHPFKSREVSEYLYSYNIISDTYDYNYCPLYEMPLLKEYSSECVNAKKLTDSIITLPTHEGLTREDLNFLVQVIKKLDQT
jgi:dTDP-4-amino-4,6-dideoxygalactose transaminase